ncbi:MAG TPA: choice-of-anchor Q domain-containing protein, partial [Thermomicrobiales bacterium]|nr:choice-of-anchor Q domain-containing protein [Thermomicrobiales bacterium]
AADPMGVPGADQRGFARSAGGAPDIGAYERQPFVVTSTSATGPGSLAQALAQNHDGSPIIFAPALAGQTILFGGKAPNVAGTQVVGGRLVIGSNVTIDGSAAPGLVLSGGNAVGVLEIAAGANVTLKALTVEYGSAVTGGGILVDAGATLTLNGDTVSYNTATGNGGGVENLGTLNIVQSTFANNTAGGNGGGIDTTGTATLESATIGHNTANIGGGLSMEGGTVTAHNSIIGDNTAPTDPDLNATLTSLGYNMIGNAQGVTGIVATDLVGADPQLGPLANNGGPTQTLAPAATSAAIDGGDPNESLTTDQRGLKRDAGLAADVGALESQYAPPVASPGGGTTGYMIRAGQSLTLNAGASFDPEGLPLTYTWDINGDGKFG